MDPLAPSPAIASGEFIVDSPPQPSKDQQYESAEQENREIARIIFNKTIAGHYRHDNLRYRQVGAMFITWETEEMQFNETATDNLRQLLASDFHFNTEFSLQLPSERWEIIFHKRLADYLYDHDNPGDLAIIYYGGHSPVEADVEDRTTALLNSIRTMLRVPACDVLLIIDCSFSAKAFIHESFRKNKLELLVSAANDARSPAPFLPQSFTSTLYKSLKSLLKEKPGGFTTSCLYRETYHTMPVTNPPQVLNTKPLHFNQNGLASIVLQPQVHTHNAKPRNQDSTFLKLAFRLNKEPDLTVLNELALHLQYLPHVEQISFEDLFAPREKVTAFMKTVVQAQKLKPLIRRLQAKRRLQRISRLKAKGVSTETSQTLFELETLARHRSSAWGWTATRVSEHGDKSSHRSQDGDFSLLRAQSLPPATGTIAAANEGRHPSSLKRRRSETAKDPHESSNKAPKLK